MIYFSSRGVSAQSDVAEQKFGAPLKHGNDSYCYQLSAIDYWYSLFLIDRAMNTPSIKIKE